MTKQEIMNNYAIEQGYDSWEDLYIQSDMVFSHFNNVTDLIQEEFRFKILENIELVTDYKKVNQSILNTEII